MTFAEVLHTWVDSDEFRACFNSALASLPYAAFRWETPRVTRDTTAMPFECVVLDSPDLDRKPDPRAFDEHFSDDPSGVVTFPNLGRNAILVVPCPQSDELAYGHLAAFARNAPVEQRSAFWKAVGEAMMTRLDSRPVWLNTAGAGVPWLHVRLDDRPKYYRYKPFK